MTNIRSTRQLQKSCCECGVETSQHNQSVAAGYTSKRYAEVTLYYKLANLICCCEMCELAMRHPLVRSFVVCG